MYFTAKGSTLNSIYIFRKIDIKQSDKTYTHVLLYYALSTPNYGS